MLFDNITNIVRDDLRKEIKHGSRVSIAHVCHQELKKQLEFIEEFRFIFIAPTFVKEKPRNKKASSTSHGYRVKRASTVPNSRSGFVTK